MAQLEMEKSGIQLLEAQKMKQSLQQINPDLDFSVIQSGSIVETDQGNFFIAIGAGALTVYKKDYYGISAASPIAKGMWGKKAGEVFSFNKKEYHIKTIS
jgi:transcription elongation GreA/GreB family factor